MTGRFVSIAILALCLCSPARAGADDGGKFARLLSVLEPESNMVVIVDLDKVSADYQKVRNWMMQTPAVASTPAAKAELEKQFGQLDDELKKIQQQYSVDIFKDLHLMAIGIRFANQGEPGLVAVVQGKFAKQLPSMIADGAQPQIMEGHEVYLDNDDDDGPVMISLLDDLLVFADPASMPAVLKNKHGAESILKAHPYLGSGLAGDEIMKMDVAFGKFLKEIAVEPDLRAVSTLLGSLSRVRLRAGEGFSLSLDFDDAKGAQRGEYFLKGMREFMLGGSHMYRAYGKFLLGFDLDKMPEMPLAAKEALKNQKAVSKTMDEIFPPVTNKPAVVHRANTVEISGSRQMTIGASFVLGIGSAIAIPAFVGYARKSRVSQTQMALADVQTALDMYRLDYMRYPDAKEGLGVLVKKGMLKELPKDSYGNSLIYEPKGKNAYTLRSLGADGKPGGEGEARDVVVESEE